MIALDYARALVDGTRARANRAGTRLHHGLRVLSGLDDPALGPSEREEIWRRGPMTLYRYRTTATGPGNDADPILFVMSLVTKPTVFDLAPGMSLVEILLAEGFDVYLLDWGTPGPTEADNSIADYTLRYLPQVLRAVSCDANGRSVNVLGYCLGGTIALLSAAADPSLPLGGIVLVATPIAFAQMGPIATMFSTGVVRVEDAINDTGNIPPSAVANVIKLVKPTGDLTTWLSLWDSLPHRQLLSAHRTLMAWAGDHIPFPGRTAVEFVEFGMKRNLLAAGEFPLDDRVVHLTDVRCRVLNLYGTQDALVPPAAHEMLAELLPNAEYEALALETGHAGLFVGSKSRKAMAAMVQWFAR